MRRITIEDRQRTALNKGGWCLSSEYVDSKTKLWWQCGEGHIWNATPHSIKSGGRWCPYCAGTIKRTIEEMQEIALKRGGWCLSPEYFTTHVKLYWQCGQGHIWWAKPNNIKSCKQWCPVCARKRFNTKNPE